MGCYAIVCVLLHSQCYSHSYVPLSHYFESEHRQLVANRRILSDRYLQQQCRRPIYFSPRHYV